jgi:hypothetical protein
MSFELWEQNGHLRKHSPTVPEIAQLLAVVDRELSDAQVVGLSTDGMFMHAYDAALELCTIALHAAGYTIPKGAGKHLYTVNSLELTLGASAKETRTQLSFCQAQRGKLMYERVGVVQERDAFDLIQLAMELRTAVLAWLKQHHPQLLPPESK